MTLKKHHAVLLLMLAVSGLLWIEMFLFFLHKTFGFSPGWNLLQYCLDILEIKYLYHHYVEAVLNGVIAYCMGLMFFVLGKQVYLSKKWNVYVKRHCHESWTESMNHQFRFLGQRIVIVHHRSKIAMTSGFFRPEIVISTSLIQELSKRELTAVLLHECSHCKNYDPLRVLVVCMMKDSLPFVPVFNKLYHYIKVWIELDADRYALKHFQSPYHFANALMKTIRTPQGSHTGVGFADEAINYRIQQLIDPGNQIRVPLIEARHMLISVLSIALLSCIVASDCLF